MADKQQKIELLLNDILEEILVRLPLAELARYKLVCKDWRDLIESSYFVSKHINRSTDPSSHIILLQDEIPCREPVPFKYAARFMCDNALMVGSINGLVCIVGNYCDKFTTPDDVWILNPVTGNATKLPPPASPMILDNYSRVSFAFDWDPSTVTSGYKVFKITSKSTLSSTEARECILSSGNAFYKPIDSNSIEVWSSESPDMWYELPMTINRPFFLPTSWISHCDAVVGGVAYWLVVDRDYSASFVLSLDTRSYKLTSIPLPHISTPIQTVIRDEESCFFGTIWEDRFALILEEGSDDGAHYYSVWRLDCSGVSWCDKFSFRLHYDIYSHFNSINNRLVLELDDGMIYFYNTKIGKLESSRNEGFSEFSNKQMVNYDNVSSAHDFVGSLLSIAGFRPFEDSENFPYLVFMWPGSVTSTSGFVGNRNANEGIHDDSDDDNWGKPKELSFMESFFTPRLSCDVIESCDVI
ncbi:hypothetical protein CASFOL_031453 [Castilleja foliolosa]|uniref:F-box domain-containing protein n=1 Tax=Castilleja foliolosa TaxID=1961234 RepID=A0ABD3C4R0_9LAMI